MASEAQIWGRSAGACSQSQLPHQHEAHARRRSELTPQFAPSPHISITPPWCCGSSTLAFAAAQAFLSNSYRYFPLGQCFRSAVSAGRRPHVQKRDTSASVTIIHHRGFEAVVVTILPTEPVADPARIAHCIEAPRCPVAPPSCRRTQHLPPA